MFSEKIYGFTRGIVIKNDDPTGRAGCKIYTPQYSSYIIEGQYTVKNLGKNIIPSLQKSLNETTNASLLQLSIETIEEIAKTLPWAYQASPLVGSGGMGTYNRSKDTYAVSDATPSGGAMPSRIAILTKREEIKEKPNVSNSGTTNVRANLDTSIHTLPGARGSFSIPKVGSHVWVFFEGGDINHPIYFAYSFNGDEWNSQTKGSQDKPRITNNDIPSETNKDASGLMVGKYTLSERGGTLEINNTDGAQGVKICDFWGNKYETGPHGVFENVTRHQKTTTVDGDYFIKVRGNYKVEVEGDSQVVAKGTTHQITGNLDDHANQKKWIETAAPAFQNAARAKSMPNFDKLRKNIAKSAEKKAPNDTFCLPFSLKFKLPFGIPFSLWLKKLNLMLKTVGQYLDMGLLLLKAAQEIVSEILSIINNPLAFLLAMLGDQIKLLGIKLCNNKNK
jgi:hypothetical protein